MSLLGRARKENGKYLNPVPTTVGDFGTMLKVLPLYFTNKEESEPKQPLGPFHTDTRLYATPPASGLRVTWFGHSAMLLEIDGLRVLIDPVWEQRASPVEFFGPKRFFAPTLTLEEMPELDVILVSHDHYDHFGANTLKHLATLKSTQRATWITAAGVGKRLEKLGVPTSRISALDWTQTIEVPGRELAGGLRITAWPSRHFSGRTPWDRNSTLWASYVIESPQHRVYYGADSGLWDGFAEIGAQYDRFDLIMLEIGASHPLWSNIHLGPDNATKAYLAMGGPEKCGPLFPIHWGLFNLALHGWKQPIDRMCEIADEQNLPLWLPEPGQPTEVVAGSPSRSSWWKRF
ncbi:MAG: MBL fold metallo-hydrolase [Acidobacteriaceae bacterium]|nr:MBL fold metallo-hydrolase [Acidobacteriaceae bacterium]